jgi:starch phosphorylase
MSDRTQLKGYEALLNLALNFSGSWHRNHATDEIWKQLDPELWELLHAPLVILHTVSTETLKAKLNDAVFMRLVNDLDESNRLEAKTPSWFQKKHPSSPLSCVAYFSMEYMLHESLPIYSGGLGNVAGDQLKGASDLGVPVIAIGILYQQGYFRQIIDKDGVQHALYPYNEPGQLAVTPLRKANGEWLRLEIKLPGWSVWLRAWEARVGRVKLYLLDSNDAVNFPPHRGITSELYGGDSQIRLEQEIILGIGGWRLLRELGLEPEVCHLNEGHAALAVLERARDYMNENKCSFEVALTATRVGNHFTTHTAVPAGFDRFSPALIEQLLGHYIKDQLGMSMSEFLSFGRLYPTNNEEPFNMAYLAIRGSGSINGVSKLHGEVSRSIFQPLFPRYPTAEVPVSSVTNGVHMPSWSSVAAGELWQTECGANCWQGSPELMEKKIRALPDTTLWKMKTEARKSLIDYARCRLANIWESRGFSEEEIGRAKQLFDSNTLTLGFARRFATYKRPNMLLHDPDRLFRILLNQARPVQLLIAGKAHPADMAGQAMIKQWIRLFERSEARAHIIFLSDYDMQVTENLVRGVDLWINTPRRPWEACGTSGMKVLPNGGLNLSELDGWWAEAYSPDIGWAIGDRGEHGEDPAWDAAEANALYDILENQVVPEFYARNSEGIPTAWVARMRESMARLTPQFSVDRAVREYTESFYIHSAEKFKKRTADKGAIAAEIVKWRQTLQNHWHLLRFGDVKIETSGGKHTFESLVYLDDIKPEMVRVELFAQGTAPLALERVRSLAADPLTHLYKISIPDNRPAADFTLRLLPASPHAIIPLECPLILWQK